MKAILSNICLAFCSIIVCFLILEVLTRLFFPDRNLVYLTDHELLSRIAPSQEGTIILGDGRESEPIRINQFGFRGEEISSTATTRILFLGDSFAFGWGVKENESLVSLIDRALGDEIEVINAGHPGYGIYQKEILLRRIQPVLVPSEIVLVLWQGALLRQPLSQNDKEAFLSKSKKIKELKSLSVLGTHVYRAFERFSLSLGLNDIVVSLGDGALSDGSALTRYETALRAEELRLASIKKYADSVGSKFSLVLWPEDGFVTEQEAGVTQFVEANLQRIANAYNFPFLSLRATLRNYSLEELLLPIDWHPTPFAHCVASKEILRFLKPTDKKNVFSCR